jgi:hypothetical protein
VYPHKHWKLDVISEHASHLPIEIIFDSFSVLIHSLTSNDPCTANSQYESPSRMGSCPKYDGFILVLYQFWALSAQQGAVATQHLGAPHPTNQRH